MLKRRRLLKFSHYGASAAAPVFDDPTDFGVRLLSWVDFTDGTTINAGSPVNNDLISQILDKGTCAFTFAQATSASQPTFKTNLLGGKSGALFAGTNPGQRLIAASTALISPTTAHTVFAVLRCTTVAPFNYSAAFTVAGASKSTVMAWDSSESFSYAGINAANNWAPGVKNTKAVNHYYFIRVSHDGAGSAASNFTASFNGSAVVLAAFTNAISAGSGDVANIIGDAKSPWFYPFHGEILERMIVSGVSSDDENTAIQAYFSAKYGGIPAAMIFGEPETKKKLRAIGASEVTPNETLWKWAVLAAGIAATAACLWQWLG